MSRKYGRWLALGALLIVPLLLGVVVMRPQVAAGSTAFDATDTSLNSPPQQGTTAGQYFWSFAAKFVCGFQDQTPGAIGEPPVKPGNYATEINIHNYNYRDIKIAKKLVLLVGTQRTAQGQDVPFAFREPQVARPTPFVSLGLGPDGATMDDCNAIWAMADQVGYTLVPGKLTIGYLVVISPLDLDINNVYTAEVPGGPAPSTPTGISLDVLTVQGKRVYIPANTLP